MTRAWRRRAALAVALAACGVVAVAAPAAAAPEGRVQTVVPEGDSLRIAYSAVDGREAVTVDPRSFELTAQSDDGVRAPLPTRVRSTAEGAAGGRYAMLVLDTSLSMTPERLRAAKSAANLFLDTVPADVQVGLITFGDPARVRVRPTQDRDAVRAQVARLSAEGDTALFEAVVKATELMPRRSASRSVVLLTDGENDDRIRPVLREAGPARRALEQSDTLLTGVAVDAGFDDLERLDPQQVAFADEGPQLEERLGQVFGLEADVLGKQVVLEATVPRDLVGKSGTLRLAASSDDGRAIAPIEVETRFGVSSSRAGAQAAPELLTPQTRGPAVTTPVVLVALVGLFVALCMLLTTATGALAGGRSEESEIVRRLSVYTFSGRETRRSSVREQTTVLGNSALARGAVELAERVARGRNLDRSLDARLDAAGLPLRTAEWTVLHIAAGIGGALLFLLIGAGQAVAGVIGLLLGLAGPWLFLSVRRSRREAAFLQQLPDTLQLLAGSLQAGYSLPQSMDTVVREARPPIGTEFNRALIESRLGVPPEEALEGIARRTGSRDFAWIVMAIRIQREVGGNLAELLLTVAETLRERQRLRRQISALSAEGRLSGIILAALPVLFTVYLLLVQPDYLEPMFTTPLGLLMLGFGALALLVGGVWMSRVVKVEV